MRICLFIFLACIWFTYDHLYAHALVVDQINPASGKAFAINPPPPINPIDTTPVRLNTQEKRSQQLIRRTHNHPPSVSGRRDGAIIFTFGEPPPSIICAPLNLCMLKLQPGEHIAKDGAAIGDSVQWDIHPAWTQTPEGTEQAVIIIKPFDSGLRTTLALITDRHIYALKLVSVPKAEQSMSIAEFRYPQDDNRAWEKAPNKGNSFYSPTSLPSTLHANPAKLDFNYEIKGNTVPWRSVRIYNDGLHVYIAFADNFYAQQAPVLMLNEGPSSKALVNYHQQGNIYVVDHLFTQATLQSGSKKHKKHVTICYHPHSSKATGD